MPENESFFNQTTGDPIIDRVCDMHARRTLHGIRKYGTTLAGNPAGMMEWLQHAQDEAADLTAYLERAMDELKRLAYVQSELHRMADHNITPTSTELRILGDLLGNMTTQTVKVSDQKGTLDHD